MKHNIQLNFKEFLFIFSCTLCFLHNKIEVTGREPAPKDCEPKSCGNGINITYPFWLEGHQPSYCGYPSLKINCKDDSTTKSLVLNVTNMEFYIENIFYDNQSVLIIPAEFADNPCPIPRKNLTVDIYPFRASPANDIIFFLLNCSNPLRGYNNISCAGNGKLDYFGGVFDNNTELNPDCKLCKFVKVPTVRYTEENSNNVAKILTDGWLVNWDIPGCSFCKETGGTCGYNNSKANDFMCICSDRVHKVHCSEYLPSTRTNLDCNFYMNLYKYKYSAQFIRALCTD